MSETVKSSNELVTCEVRDGVGIISLNRPERHNSITEDLRAQLRAAFAWAAADKAVRCILIRGNGRSFCSGRDTSQMGVREEGVTHHDALTNSQAVRMEQFRVKKPIVAAIHGAVLGAGAELALTMDFRVAADNLKLSLPEVNYGLVPDTGGSILALSLAGPSRAKWLIMSGEQIGAQDALAWGLVDWVVPLEQLEDKAFSIARMLASKPPRALAAAKALINDRWETIVLPALKDELLAQCVLFEGAEYKDIKAARNSKK